MALNFWQKRKITNAALKNLETQLTNELLKNEEYNKLLQTDDFTTIIRDLFNQCTVPGQIVTITLNSGHKIEIKKTIPEDTLLRDFDKPYF